MPAKDNSDALEVRDTGLIVYYGLVPLGRRWTEVIVRRENGRQVSQEPTGVTYPTARAGQDGVFAKNPK